MPRDERRSGSASTNASFFCCTKRAYWMKGNSTIGWRCSRRTPATGCRASRIRTSALDTVSLIYDDRQLLETRVRRLASPRIYSQEPRSRTSRIVTNVSIEEDADAAFTLVRSKFMLIEFRRDEQRLFGGTSFHRLTVAGGDIKIAWKRVDLVNCDGPMDGIVVPF